MCNLKQYVFAILVTINSKHGIKFSVEQYLKETQNTIFGSPYFRTKSGGNTKQQISFATTTATTNTSDKGKLRTEEKFSVTNNLHQGKRSVVFDPETFIVLNLRNKIITFVVVLQLMCWCERGANTSFG